jgi:hypothetical protein
MAGQGHCPACGGFTDLAGHCGTARCGNYRGAANGAAGGTKRAKSSDLAAPPKRVEAVASSIPLGPAAPAGPDTTVDGAIGFQGWLEAIARVERETRIERPAHDRCPQCRQPYAATIEGSLGFHLCSGDVGDTFKSLFRGVDSMVGNY